MDNDDKMVGQLVNRRKAMRMLGIGGLGAFVGAAAGVAGSWGVNTAQYWMGGGKSLKAGVGTASTTTIPLPQCIVRPAGMEGPYFADRRLHRRDIREDTNSKNMAKGIPLDLTFQVSQILQGGSCNALKDVIIDIWQCDALGIYSAQIEVQTTDSDFLRGYQTTNSNGKATFKTVYPGWYTGRAAHIHFKIRLVGSNNLVNHEFSSQLFFDEAITDEVYALEPYNSKGKRDTLNSTDGIYRNGGHQLLLDTKKKADGTYAAVIGIALNIA